MADNQQSSRAASSRRASSETSFNLGIPCAVYSPVHGILCCCVHKVYWRDRKLRTWTLNAWKASKNTPKPQSLSILWTSEVKSPIFTWQDWCCYKGKRSNMQHVWRENEWRSFSIIGGNEYYETKPTLCTNQHDMVWLKDTNSPQKVSFYSLNLDVAQAAVFEKEFLTPGWGEAPFQSGEHMLSLEYRWRRDQGKVSPMAPIQRSSRV